MARPLERAIRAAAGSLDGLVQRLSGKAAVRQRPRSLALFALVLVTAATTASAARPLAPLLVPPPAHPNRIIVKYRSAVGTVAHRAFTQGLPFASAPGGQSLDQLHRQLGVRAAWPLFGEQHGAVSTAHAHGKTVAAVRDRFAARTARVRADTVTPDLSNIFVLKLRPGMDAEQAAELYAADPGVEYAHPDYQRQVAFTPNDQYFGRLWGLRTTEAPVAWDTTNGTGTVVAVIDTGSDYNHTDITANLWTNPGEIPNNGIDDDGNGFVDDAQGWDFAHGDNDPYDEHGHGTHVAGIVAATGNNSIGVIGMAWGARVMAIQGLDASGRGYDGFLAQAIVYAADNGADVINASWGGFSAELAVGNGSVMHDVVKYAKSLGVVVVAAAGNAGDSRLDWFSPAGFPEVIAVGATDSFDQVAWFSNYGNALSVAAPGVDILSLLGAIAPVSQYGSIYRSHYLFLSGTSMASPHVAGLAALLLSVEPNLTPDEVRWHLELNADQLGYPGYEGLPWNPHLGWGRVNAARVFDPPPVTTRVRGVVDVHAIIDTVSPALASANVWFTTLQPVDWSVAAPSWLRPSVTSGTGPAPLSFAIDTAGLTVGDYSGSLGVDAPGAIDRGGRLDVQLHTHRETRVGGPSEVSSTNVASSHWPDPLPLASDGVGQLVLRADTAGGVDVLYAQRIDGAGNVSDSLVIDTRRQSISEAHHLYPKIAFDGRNFLAVWIDSRDLTPYYSQRSVNAVRVAASGQILDTSPIVVDSRREGYVVPPELAVGFDGSTYVILWNSYARWPIDMMYVRRLARDGTLRGSARKIYPSKAMQLGKIPTLIRNPHMACAHGSCLVIWWYGDKELTANGVPLDKAYGVRLVGGAVVDAAPIRILGDINSYGWPEVATDGDGYLVVGIRATRCPGASAIVYYCGTDLVAARVAADGSVLDSSDIVVNNGMLPVYTDGVMNFPGAPAITFDGTNYIVTFLGAGSNPSTQVFATRVDHDGRVIDTESPGLLLMPRSVGHPYGIYAPSGMAAGITATATQAIVTWIDTVNADLSSEDPASWSWTSPVFAQRVLPHAPPPGYPTLPIGDIGPQTIAEDQPLTFVLSATALDPAATEFHASNVPRGAILDPTGVFRWMPAPDQAGVYPAVHVEASDGVQTVAEDVTITVTEANLAVAGNVTVNGTGPPPPGTMVRLSRSPGILRSTSTDPSGQYAFHDLTPGTYRVQVVLPRPYRYRALRAVQKVTLGAADQTGVNFVLTPTS